MVLTPAIVAKILALAAAAVVITGPLYRQQRDVVFIQVVIFEAAWWPHRRITRFADNVNKKLDRIDQSLDRIDAKLGSRAAPLR